MRLSGANTGWGGFRGKHRLRRKVSGGKIRLWDFRGKIKIRGFLGAKKRLGEKAS